MHNFKAIGYHGTDKVISEKKHINFNHNEFKDHFLATNKVETIAINGGDEY